MHPHGIVHQSEDVAVTLGTLATKTALLLATTQASITATFLMLRVTYNLLLDSVEETEGPFIVGLCRGDATVAEIKLAMDYANSSGPLDTTQMVAGSDTTVIRWDSLIYGRQIANEIGTATVNWEFRGTRKLGRKGVPWAEGSGWKSFVFNDDSSNMTTGSAMGGSIHSEGVWLRD